MAKGKNDGTKIVITDPDPGPTAPPSGTGDDEGGGPGGPTGVPVEGCWLHNVQRETAARVREGDRLTLRPAGSVIRAFRPEGPVGDLDDECAVRFNRRGARQARVIAVHHGSVGPAPSIQIQPEV